MRPLFYGVVVFFPSGVLWWLFSVSAAVEGVTGKIGVSTTLMYVFGLLFFFSLPAALVGEIVRWIRHRRKG